MLTIYKFVSSEWPLDSIKAFLFLTLPCQRGGWGHTISWDGTEPGQLTPNDQRDILNCMVSCSVLEMAEGGAGHSEWWHLSDPVPVTWDIALLSWGCLNTCLPWEVVKGSLILLGLCAQLLLYPSDCLNLKVSLSKTMNFLIFTFLLFSPIPLVGSEWLPSAQ